jgi:adenylate kinase family enzyme
VSLFYDTITVGEVMKIYIIGTTATGKTYLSKRLSKKIDIPHYELDNLLWIRNKKGDIRRENAEIKSLFDDILKKDDWIIEDIGRDIFRDGLKASDLILFLDISKKERGKRIIKRYIMQKLRLEKISYKIDRNLLKRMFKRSNEFEVNKQDFIKMLNDYNDKLYVVNDNNCEKKLEQVQQFVIKNKTMC